jgi:hypothetical protein
MKLLMFSVFDKAVNAYLPPLYFRARGEALRSFTEAVNKPGENFNKFPNDYLFVFLGEWDDNSGIFAPVDPERVISASECLLDGSEPPPGRGN